MTRWTIILQALLSMRFSRQEFWSGLPEYLPNPGIKPTSSASSALQMDSLPLSYLGSPSKAIILQLKKKKAEAVWRPCPYWVYHDHMTLCPFLQHLSVLTWQSNARFFFTFPDYFLNTKKWEISWLKTKIYSSGDKRKPQTWLYGWISEIKFLYEISGGLQIWFQF